MNVLHVYRTYFPDSQGGLEEVIRQICKNTQVLGVNSRVLTITRSDDAPLVVKRPEADVYRTRQTFEIASCNVSLGSFKAFREQLKWADVVHYHFPWPFADLMHLSAAVEQPTLVTYHSDIVRQRSLGYVYYPLMQRFLSQVDRIVCTSPNYFATSNVLSQFSDKVDVIPIGITRSSYPEGGEEHLAELEQEYGRNFFLFVGVLRYYKGLHILLKAIEHAPYRVVIAGSGPTENELAKEAKRKGLDNVKFTGYVDDKTKVGLFKLCKGIVFPSFLRSEAFGVTLLEGAMFGKPLISTEVGSGTSHVNIHEETGFVLPPGSHRALREAMDKLHYHPDLAERMGRNAALRYQQLFTGQRMGERYAETYEQLLRQSSLAQTPSKVPDLL